MPPRLIILFTLPAIFQFSKISAQQKSDTLTTEKALSIYRLSDPQFSPDGRKLAFVVNQPATVGKSSASHIWLLDLRDSSTRQYTNSEKSESSPKWSPKGKKLAFLSARNGKNQIYLLDDEGGEAMELSASKAGVSFFEWSPDGKSIAYLEEDSVTAEEKKRQDDKFDENVVSKGDKASVLFNIDINTKIAHRLYSNHTNIRRIRWVPSGDALIMEIEELPSREIPVGSLVKFSLKDSSLSKIPSPNNPAWGGVEISPNGKQFCFVGPRNDGPIPHDIFLQPFDASAATNLTAGTLDRPVGPLKFNSNDQITAIVLHGFYPRLYKISTTGQVTDFGINQNVSSFDLRSDNTVVFVSTSSTKLPELWIQSPGHTAYLLTHFNKAFDKIPFVSPKLVSYRSFDGTSIEAFFFRPPQLKQGVPASLVVIVHGGPTGAFIDNYNSWAQLFLQRGYAVMMANIRGSTGYGWKFLESNRNDWGGGDFKDIMAGVDYLIANENIDSNKLAIVGWSYGGYMSEWAITQTHRFKASMSGAGLFNLASEFGTENGASYDNWCLGNPYENPKVFTEHSPITFIKNAKTPTLIIQGEDDDVDPIGQSQELYRALHYYNVPAELVTYPREHHGFTEFRHISDYVSRMLDWVQKYCPANK